MGFLSLFTALVHFSYTYWGLVFATVVLLFLYCNCFSAHYHDLMFTIAIFFVSNSQRIFFFRGNWSNVQCVCLNLNVAMLFSSEATVKNLSYCLAKMMIILLVCWVLSPTIVSWWICRYPELPLSLLECRLTSVPANSGIPYVLFSAKVMHAKKIRKNFSMTLLKIGHMGYLRLMHGPGYLST